MKIGHQIRKEVFDSFIPEQFTFPDDREKFVEYKKLSGHDKLLIFIAKPVASSEGNSILLFKE